MTSSVVSLHCQRTADVMQAQSIKRQNASYRQGLILGLTMAEVLLLLVFCLMIGLITYLQRAQQERDVARREAEIAKVELAKVEKAYEALATSTANPELVVNPEFVRTLVELAGSAQKQVLDETWRRIVRNDKLVRELAAQGVKLDSLTKEQIAAIKEVTSSTSSTDAAARAKAYDSLKAEMVKALSRSLTDEQFAKIVSDAGKSEGHKWPPIISLSEAGGYSFSVGSAELTGEFNRKIRGPVVERLLEITRQFDVNIIEVVGHTDDQAIVPKPSNLDRNLLSVVNGQAAIGTIRPGDNAGLGLARAVSVVSVLQSDPRLSNLSILPLSGAQLINVNETLARDSTGADAKERRRIEIRVRKSAER